MSYATIDYISFLSCLYSVGFLYVSYCSILTGLYQNIKLLLVKVCNSWFA